MEHPDSIQMGVVASFFKVSMVLRNVHSLMTEQYELPSWSVYVMFATVTILVGALLGLLLVFFIDCVLPYLMGSGVKQCDSPPLEDRKEDKGNDSTHDSELEDDISDDVGESSDH